MEALPCPYGCPEAGRFDSHRLRRHALARQSRAWSAAPSPAWGFALAALSQPRSVIHYRAGTVSRVRLAGSRHSRPVGQAPSMQAEAAELTFRAAQPRMIGGCRRRPGTLHYSPGCPSRPVRDSRGQAVSASSAGELQSVTPPPKRVGRSARTGTAVMDERGT